VTQGLTIEDQVLTALRRIVRAIDLHSRRLVEQSGLTGPQLVTLREVARLGRVRPGVLAKGVNLSHATVTGILDRLEQRGLVARTRDGEDRRGVIVAVTPKGEVILKDAPSLLQDQFRLELSRLEEWECTMILTTLQRIATMMEAEEIEAAPVLVTGSMAATPAEIKGTMPSLSVEESAPESPQKDGSGPAAQNNSDSVNPA
jgi:DNA-binding MarR family transcriptional regulator